MTKNETLRRGALGSPQFTCSQEPLLKKRPIHVPSDPELRAFNAAIVPAMTMVSEKFTKVVMQPL